jgi:hypothetical protein
MTKLRKLLCLTAVVATATLFLSGFQSPSVSANNAPQTPPFSQNWTSNTITTNDDWSPIAGIVGFLGDYTAASPTGVDPRTLLDPFTNVAVDVIANQANPDTLTNGGVAEFDGIPNPTIALNGSGTADAPFIVIYLNTTGLSNIRLRYNARDLDASADDSLQPIATQYRIGNSGNFRNINRGFINDASGTGTATLVIPVDVTLPPVANNRPLVEVRIMTTNSPGNDEWIGIDDIQVTTDGTPTATRLDFDGDNVTDYAVARNTGGQLTWYTNNGFGGTTGVAWGLSGDEFAPADYDADGITDYAVFRAPNFYILQSSNGAVRVENFGLAGDDPGVVADYDGDRKADLAVYRPGASVGAQSFWFYRGSFNNPSGNVTYVPWGLNGDKPGPGDYDGDGRADFVVKRGGGFWLYQTTAGMTSMGFGLPSDQVIPGDWDGDGKTDVAVIRASGASWNWYYAGSADNNFPRFLPSWGNTATDLPVPGDYNGDGRMDQGIWRSSTGGYWILTNTVSSAATTTTQFGWGLPSDYPLANVFVY